MRNDKIIIKPLSSCKDFAPILAFWSYRQWYAKRSVPFEAVARNYIERTGNSRIPVSFVAIAETLPVGMVSLKENDLWSRKDLNPWLASLFVLPDFRRRGIGRLLITSVINHARDLGLSEIFLFLGKSEQKALEEYYEKLNWRFLDSGIDNDGEETKIFSYRP